jgi:PhnB protein
VRVHDVFTYLCVSDTAAAITFYQAAFGARETMRLTMPDGRVGHAEITVGPSRLMLSDPFPEVGIEAPDASRGAAVTIHLHVDDADAVIARAVDAGATLTVPPRDQSHGERSGAVRDPFGHRWLVGHEIEKVSPEEMQRRLDG